MLNFSCGEISQEIPVKLLDINLIKILVRTLQETNLNLNLGRHKKSFIITEDIEARTGLILNHTPWTSRKVNVTGLNEIAVARDILETIINSTTKLIFLRFTESQYLDDKGNHILFLGITDAESLFDMINLELVEKTPQQPQEPKKIDWLRINKQSSGSF